MYDAFISYSHAKDKPIAARLQYCIQSLGKSWWQRRKMRVFRDATSLTAVPGVWNELEAKLKSSRYLILLASHESAKSQWVDKEVFTWLEHRGPEDGPATLFIALTEGELRWDSVASDFVWGSGTPLPPSMKAQFKSEPLWVDLREYRAEEELDHLNSNYFAVQAAKIAARIYNVPLEDLLSEEVTQQRRALRLAWSAAASLMLLAGISMWLWQLTVSSDREARRALALGDQQKAIDLSTRESDPFPGRSLAYLARAIRNYSSDSAMGQRALFLIADFPHIYPVRSKPTEPPAESQILAPDNNGDVIFKSPDESWELMFGSDLKVRRSGAAEWGIVEKTDSHEFDFEIASFARSTQLVAVGGGGYWLEGIGSSEIKLIEASAVIVAKRKFDGEKVKGLALSPDGRLLFVSLLSPRTGGGDERGKPRTVIFSIGTAKNNVSALTELGSIDGPPKRIGFLGTSRQVLIDSQLYEIGPVLEKEPVSGLKTARALHFSPDGDHILTVNFQALNDEPYLNSYRLIKGAAILEPKIQLAQTDFIRFLMFRATLSEGKIRVSGLGKDIAEFQSERIILLAVSKSGKRFILIRDDGLAQIIETEAAKIGNGWRQLTTIFGTPWHEWTGNFVTVFEGNVDWWHRLYRNSETSPERWRNAFGGTVAHEFADASTDVALHPSKKMVAVGSMGHAFSELGLFNANSRVRIFDPIKIHSQYIEHFFSRDGATLLVSGSSSMDVGGYSVLLETSTGLPIRIWASTGAFAERPDGKRLLDLQGEYGSSDMSDVLGGESPVPTWIADLGEGLSGLRIDENSVVVKLSTNERIARIDSVRKALARARPDGWTEFGHWYFSTENDPLISPYSSMRRSELEVLQRLRTVAPPTKRAAEELTSK